MNRILKLSFLISPLLYSMKERMTLLPQSDVWFGHGLSMFVPWCSEKTLLWDGYCRHVNGNHPEYKYSWQFLTICHCIAGFTCVPRFLRAGRKGVFFLSLRIYCRMLWGIDLFLILVCCKLAFYAILLNALFLSTHSY